MINASETGRKARVVIRFGVAPSSEAAMQTAVNLARAFGADIQGEFVEDVRFAAASALPCTRVVSPMGRRSWAAYEHDIAAEMRALGAALSRRFEQIAAHAHVRYHSTISDPGSENSRFEQYVVMTGPLVENGYLHLNILSGPGGIVITGPNARIHDGPVAVILEPSSDVAALMEKAQTLAVALKEDVVAVPFCSSWTDVLAIEHRAMTAGQKTSVTFYRDCVADAAQIALALRGTRAGFAVAEYGGALIPDETQLSKLASLIGVPMLISPKASHSS